MADMRRRGAELESKVRAALMAEGFEVEEQELRLPSGRWDLLLVREGKRYLAEIVVQIAARGPVLEGRLAALALRGVVDGPELDARPLVVLGAERMSEPMAVRLREFAERYLPSGVAYGLFDCDGRLELYGEGLTARRAPRADPERPARPAPRMDPFSDRNQWMLKLLLSHHLPEPHRLVPGGSPVRSARELKELAGGSSAAAHRLVRWLEESHHRGPKPPLVLRRRAEILAGWLAASRGPYSELEMRPVFPVSDPLASVQSVLGRWKPELGRVCLGLFAACAQRGFDYVWGAPIHVYLEQVSQAAFDALDLVECKAGEPVSVVVRSPRFPESVFRGASPIDGVPAADVLQCWLDVSHHEARGAEMAKLLDSRILRQGLLDDDPWD